MIAVQLPFLKNFFKLIKRQFDTESFANLNLHSLKFGNTSENVGRQSCQQVVVQCQPEETGETGESIGVDLAQVVGQQEELLHLDETGESATVQHVQQIATDMQFVNATQTVREKEKKRKFKIKIIKKI